MAIESSEVRKVARLARLKFSESEYENFAQDLSRIMDMIDDISDVDTEGTEPLTSVNDATLRMRADEVVQQVSVEELFGNVPGKNSTLARDIKCFVVPKMVE